MERLLPLAAEMGRLHALDQYSRRSLTSAFGKLESEAEFEGYTEAVAAHLDAIDLIVTDGLKLLLARSSWTEFAEAPEFLLGPALHIIKHTADTEFQQTALSELRSLAEQGLVPPAEIASLIDAAELAAGRRQIYGNRLKCVDGERVAFDLLSPDDVDERRKTMGLPSLKTYISKISENAPPCPTG
jgi:hypothetical protein